jgi:hypothetical protein
MSTVRRSATSRTPSSEPIAARSPLSWIDADSRQIRYLIKQFARDADQPPPSPPRCSGNCAGRADQSGDDSGSGFLLLPSGATPLPLSHGLPAPESSIGTRRRRAISPAGDRGQLGPGESIEGLAIATGFNAVWIDREDAFWKGFQVT